MALSTPATSPGDKPLNEPEVSQKRANIAPSEMLGKPVPRGHSSGCHQGCVNVQRISLCVPPPLAVAVGTKPNNNPKKTLIFPITLAVAAQAFQGLFTFPQMERICSPICSIHLCSTSGGGAANTEGRAGMQSPFPNFVLIQLFPG